MKFRTIATGLVAAAALALPASAMADTSMVDSLSGPAHIDGHTYSAAQMKHRYAGDRLFFVLGSREEGQGAVAAFHSSHAAKAYLRSTGRLPGQIKAHAAYNAGQTVFYSDAFLEGYSIAANNNSGIGNLAQNCMAEGFLNLYCITSWDNQISSAKTGSDGAYLYNLPYLNTTGGYVYIPGTDSVEVWRYFNDVASSVWVP